MKFYCYKGDIKELIPNGWIFQKLFANNYKSYRKNDIIMFVICKMMLEITNLDDYHQPTLIKFILDNKNKLDSFWQVKTHSPLFIHSKIARWTIQNGEIMTREQAVINKSKWFKEYEKDNNIEYLEDGFRIRQGLIQDIIELENSGHLELKEVA